MKRRDLEKHLREHECEFLEHGSRHDTWVDSARERQASVPRHRELKFGTVRAICHDLGVPVPKKRG